MICHGDFYTNLLRRLAALFVGAVQSVVDIFVSCSPFTSGKFPSIFVVGSPFALTQVKKKLIIQLLRQFVLSASFFWWLIGIFTFYSSVFDCLPIASRCFSTYFGSLRHLPNRSELRSFEHDRWCFQVGHGFWGHLVYCSLQRCSFMESL